jgi:TPR repeat protein
MAWWRKAADQGDAQSMVKLATAYQIGKFVPRDAEQSVSWLRTAVEKDDPVAEVRRPTLLPGGADDGAAVSVRCRRSPGSRPGPRLARQGGGSSAQRYMPEYGGRGAEGSRRPGVVKAPNDQTTRVTRGVVARGPDNVFPAPSSNARPQSTPSYPRVRPVADIRQQNVQDG